MLTVTVGRNSIDGGYHRARPKKNIVQLSDSDVKRLKALSAKRYFMALFIKGYLYERPYRENSG